MTDELKPCPFCGPGESVVEPWFDDVAQRWRVGCGRCGCSTGFHPRDKTQAPAIAAWNRRAAGASEGQAEPIYQVRPRNGEEWTDVSEAEYHISGGAGYLQRIVYLRPSAEIAALRERIAGMEKDAERWRIAREFEYVTDFEVLGIDQRIDAGFAKEPK